MGTRSTNVNIEQLDRIIDFGNTNLVGEKFTYHTIKLVNRQGKFT